MLDYYKLHKCENNHLSLETLIFFDCAISRIILRVKAPTLAYVEDSATTDCKVDI